MALRDRIQELLGYIEENRGYLGHNEVLLDIHAGNLLQYILSDLSSSLSEDYFSKIKTRVIPINILTMLIDKMAKAYVDPPIRTLREENESDQKLLDHYQEQMDVDREGDTAEEFSFLTKGFAWEPFLDGTNPMLRTIPFDRFLPKSEDLVDRKKVTTFIKIIGEREVTFTVHLRFGRTEEKTEMRTIYFAYTDEEFLAFDSAGDIYEPGMALNDGVNPVGEIPFYVGNRSRDRVLPVQDSDILRMTKVIPVILSDVSGAIMFKCFNIIWGIDVDFENITLSPNAVWSMKSTGDADRPSQMGTLDPKVDSDKVLKFVFGIFTFWLETKGVKVGNVGNIDGEASASGIAKLIDSIDTTDLRKKSIVNMKKDEKGLWDKIKISHNHWVDSGQITGFPRFSENFAVMTEYDEPTPFVDREKEVKTVDAEVEKGYETPENAIKRLYPDLDDDQVVERLEHYNSVNTVTIVEEPTDGETTESDDIDS